MTNLDILNEEIERLERQELTYAIANKLAPLYIVRQNMSDETTRAVPANEIRAAREELEPKPEESAFLAVIKTKDAADVWPVLDELMGVLQATNTRLYEGVMRKLSLL